MSKPVIVVKGKEKAEVIHPVDLAGWIEAGWKVEGTEEKEKGPSKRDLLIEEAKGLDLEFAANISNKDLEALIAAAKTPPPAE